MIDKWEQRYTYTYIYNNFLDRPKKMKKIENIDSSSFIFVLFSLKKLLIPFSLLMMHDRWRNIVFNLRYEKKRKKNVIKVNRETHKKKMKNKNEYFLELYLKSRTSYSIFFYSNLKWI